MNLEEYCYTNGRPQFCLGKSWEFGSTRGVGGRGEVWPNPKFLLKFTKALKGPMKGQNTKIFFG